MEDKNKICFKICIMDISKYTHRNHGFSDHAQLYSIKKQIFQFAWL